MNNIYRIADKNIRINSLYPFVNVYCKKYRTNDEPDFEIEITDADINTESRTIRAEVPSGWVEISAVYRKIAEMMPKYDTFMIHGSAVAVDWKSYLFIAKSGTGKSTHTKLWLELLGDQA